MNETHRGACFCGTVEVEADGPPLEMGYCHCASCRAYAGGPLSAYLLWRSDHVRVVKGEAYLGRYAKTSMTERCFCTTCGGHLMSVHPELGLTDVRPGAMPDTAFIPSMHLNYAETVLPVRDGLQKLRDFPAEAGGSGETIPE